MKKTPQEKLDYLKQWRKENPNYYKNWTKKNPKYHKKWSEDNPNYHKDWQTEFRKRPGHRQYMKKYELKKYGLTIEQYEKMKKDQKYACRICFQKEDDKNTLCVDHSHITNKVRGLLCGNCNKALGLALDSVHLLGRMIGYLKTYDFYPKLTAKHLKDLTKYAKRVNRGKKVVDRDMLSKQNTFIKDIIKTYVKNKHTGTLEKFL